MLFKGGLSVLSLIAGRKPDASGQKPALPTYSYTLRRSCVLYAPARSGANACARVQLFAIGTGRAIGGIITFGEGGQFPFGFQFAERRVVG